MCAGRSRAGARRPVAAAQLPHAHGLPTRPGLAPAHQAYRKHRACAPQLLLELAEAADLRGKVDALFSGQHINATEDRAVSEAC